MHLTEVIALRPVPAAALLLALTRRCPLTCAHCSTNSMLASEEHAAEIFVKFVSTFTPDDRPELILMSGGEPMLRPKLVRELAKRAHAVGCRSHVLSGMFFARGRGIPRPIRQAIDEVDHFSASLDVFHEREVSRGQVFRVLHELVAEGKDVSLQIVGLGDDDPYLAGITDEIRRTFDDRVPVLVGRVGAVGRAASWLSVDEEEVHLDPDPCSLAAWPLVCFDGTIVGCCNQDVVDGPPPEHLRLGHAATDDWPDVRKRYLRSSMLRAIRLFGPEYLAHHYSEKVACDGYCSTCFRLSTEDPGLEQRIAAELEKPVLRAMEAVAALQRKATAVAFARRFGVTKYAELVALGAPEERAEARVA
jgi:pyruvate-formate lyase-activating enzyme